MLLMFPLQSESFCLGNGTNPLELLGKISLVLQKIKITFALIYSNFR